MGEGKADHLRAELPGERGHFPDEAGGEGGGSEDEEDSDYEDWPGEISGGCCGRFGWLGLHCSDYQADLGLWQFWVPGRLMAERVGE